MYTVVIVFTNYTPSDVEREAAEQYTKFKGFVRLRRCIDVQDNTVEYWIGEWESEADSDAFLASEEGQKLVGSSAQWSESFSTVQGVIGPKEVKDKVFTSPIIEFSTLSLHNDNEDSRKKLNDLIGGVRNATSAAPAAHDMLSGDIIECKGSPTHQVLSSWSDGTLSRRIQLRFRWKSTNRCGVC